MSEEYSLEGWAPVIGAEATLDDVVDRAFDYRGDVTLVTAGGGELVGFVYNRDRHVAQPYLQVFDAGGTSHTVRYSEILAVRFTGKDTAAGQSYEAWLRRKAEAGSRPSA